MTGDRTPNVSAFVLVYDRATWLAAALPSLRSQLRSQEGVGEIEILVVDDESADPGESRSRPRR